MTSRLTPERSAQSARALAPAFPNLASGPDSGVTRTALAATPTAPAPRVLRQLVEPRSRHLQQLAHPRDRVAGLLRLDHPVGLYRFCSETKKVAAYFKTHGPNVIRRSPGADARAPRVHQHQAPRQYHRRWPLRGLGAPNALAIAHRHRSRPPHARRTAGLDHQAGSVVLDGRGGHAGNGVGGGVPFRDRPQTMWRQERLPVEQRTAHGHRRRHRATAITTNTTRQSASVIALPMRTSV